MEYKSIFQNDKCLKRFSNMIVCTTTIKNIHQKKIKFKKRNFLSFFLHNVTPVHFSIINYLVMLFIFVLFEYQNKKKHFFFHLHAVSFIRIIIMIGICNGKKISKSLFRLIAFIGYKLRSSSCKNKFSILVYLILSNTNKML